MSVCMQEGKTALEKATCCLSPLGLISLEEFGQTWKLFTSHLGIVHSESLDKLVLSMDYNKDGYIDFNEFLEAFHVVHRLQKKADS